MKPTLSVIVPVYNVEKYLRRCIDSILDQTFNDFEVLLIDDGSTDNSSTICDEYAAIDSRINVYHKLNGGVSSARNLGLENAKGEWITFVDSDDWIDRYYFKKIISAKNEISDVLVSGFKHVYKEGESVYHYSQWGLNKVEGIRKLLISMGGTCVWGKFFRKSLIKKYNITFPFNIHYCEDFYFCALAYIYSKDVRYVDCCTGYIYFDRENSVCHTIGDKHINEAIDMNIRIREYMRKEKILSLYDKQICWRILSCIQDWVMCTEKHRLLIETYRFKKRYIINCPLFWNVRQKMLMFLVLNKFSFIVSIWLSFREILKRELTPSVMI